MPHGSGRWWCSIRPVATTGNSPTAPNATGRGGLIVSQTISARFVLRSSTGQTRSGQSFGAGAINGRTSRARLTTRCRFYRACCRTRSTRWAVSLATHARASSSFTAPTGRRSSGSRPTSRTSRRRALPTSGSQSRALRKGGQAGDSLQKTTGQISPSSQFQTMAMPRLLNFCRRGDRPPAFNTSG